MCENVGQGESLSANWGCQHLQKFPLALPLSIGRTSYQIHAVWHLLMTQKISKAPIASSI